MLALTNLLRRLGALLGGSLKLGEATPLIVCDPFWTLCQCCFEIGQCQRTAVHRLALPL